MSEQLHTSASGGAPSSITREAITTTIITDATFSPHDCPVCLCSIEDFKEATTDCQNDVCVECGPTLFQHKLCLAQCAKSYIDTSFVGSIKNILCAGNHAGGKKVQLKYNSWAKLVDAKTIEKYNSIHQADLMFLCGGCHNSKSQLIPFQAQKTINDLETELKDVLVENETFFKSLDDYICGSLDIYEFYKQLTKIHVPRLRDMDDSQAWTVITPILEVIEDISKRSGLQIRHLKTRPKFLTLCCKRVHCFNCKTRDFHEGKTCVDNIAGMDSSVLACPNCQIMLAKSDGCDSVTCVCTHRFAWSQELTKYKYQIAFVQVYVSNPIQSCARILLGILVPNDNDANPAAHYRSMNEALVDRELLKEWMDRYPQCAAMTLLKPKGVHSSALQVLRRKFERDVSRFERIHSAFKSSKMHMNALLPTDVDKLEALESLQKFGWDAHRLKSSLIEWKSANFVLYRDFIRSRFVKDLQQYLFINGNQRVENKVKPIYAKSPFFRPHQWATGSGSRGASSKAQFCCSNGSEEFFEVVIDKYFLGKSVSGGYALSFGLINGGSVSNVQDNSKIGQMAGSYGVVFQTENSRLVGKLYSGSDEVEGLWLGIKDGDVISCYVNRDAGYCEMSLNYTEFHRFELPRTASTAVSSSAASPPPPTCANGHNLRLSTFLVNDRVVTCNGGRELTGCICKKSATSIIDPQVNFSYRCETCDYDLCTPCYHNRSKNGHDYAFAIVMGPDCKEFDPEKIRLSNWFNREGLRSCSPSEAKQHFRVVHLLKTLLSLQVDLSSCSKIYRADVIDKYNQMWLDKYEGKAELPLDFKDTLKTFLSRDSPMQFYFSWEFTVCALCRTLIVDCEKEILAYADKSAELLRSHRRRDAPFYSAFVLAEDPIDGSVSQENAAQRELQLKRQSLAMAFTRTYPREVEAFYKSPAVSVITNPLASTCQCLPRHAKSQEHICPHGINLNCC